MAIHIGRRGFIVALGGTMAALPLAARAQQAEPMRRIGVLIEFDETDPEAKAYPSGLTRGLAQLGWTHGRNVRIDIRWPHLGASREVGSWHRQIPSWPSIVRQLSRWQSETEYRRWVFCRRPSDGAPLISTGRRAPRISRTQLREEMKMRNYKIAAAIIGSFVLGVGTASVLAQGTAPHYEVAEINVKDQTGYEASGVDKVRDAIKANGGKIIAGGYDKAKARTGAAVPNRFLIVQYPSKGAADKTWTTIKEWWDTAGSKHAADFRNIEVEGVEQK